MNDLTAAAAEGTGEDLQDGSHYLRAVTDMAETCQVVTHSAIYTDTGTKLVEKGARIDSRLYDRLVQHKLRQSLDENLSVENVVDNAAIEAIAREQCATLALPMRLVEALGDAQRLLAPLRSMPLPAPIAFKLTVMREQRPDLLAHSVQAMLVSLFLGLQSGWDERDCVPLAAAALLHDIGVMHMDPVWRDPLHKVYGMGRKHLVAHPVTAMLMIRAQEVYPKAVETAVLEHHERMDGTGYPRGIEGEAISPMGQILLLAEVATAIYEKYPDTPAHRLSLTLRLNHRKLPAAFIALLLPVLDHAAGADTPAMPAEGEIARCVAALAGAFASWAELSSTVPQSWLSLSSHRACAFVEQRLAALQKSLIEAGAHPQQEADFMAHLQGDARGLSELLLVTREALWQLQTLLNACQRRWPQLTERKHPGDAVVADWCDASLQQLTAV